GEAAGLAPRCRRRAGRAELPGRAVGRAEGPGHVAEAEDVLRREEHADAAGRTGRALGGPPRCREARRRQGEDKHTQGPCGPTRNSDGSSPVDRTVSSTVLTGFAARRNLRIRKL